MRRAPSSRRTCAVAARKSGDVDKGAAPLPKRGSRRGLSVACSSGAGPPNSVMALRMVDGRSPFIRVRAIRFLPSASRNADEPTDRFSTSSVKDRVARLLNIERQSQLFESTVSLHWYAGNNSVTLSAGQETQALARSASSSVLVVLVAQG